MKDNKYYIIKDKDMAITLKMLTRQEPFIYKHNFEEGKFVWSFRNDETFKKVLNIVLGLIAENK